jgi:hypothetical protein
MITTIALAVLAILLIPAFTSQRFSRKIMPHAIERKTSRIAAVLADITYATRRIHERQTAWPIERTDAVEPQPYSLHSEF